MASQKEEPNTSMLFGNATDDDPFSQVSKDKSDASKTKNTSGDVSSLFGNTSDGNADVFFSSTNATTNATPQSANVPLTSTAASFFDQPQVESNFFDNLGQESTGIQQQDQQVPTTTPAAYDSSAYNTYDYSQQQTQEQQYDQSQWIQFDPNVHYYYDDQGYVHYYDPNTNQEYDMSQYGYGEQGQTYDYQYDPQYAEYYAQQGYDPNVYQQQQEGQIQDNYDPNAYQQPQQEAHVPDNYDPNAYQKQVNQAQESYDPIVYQQQQESNAQESYNPNAYQQQQQEGNVTESYDPNASQQQDAYTQASYDPSVYQQQQESNAQESYVFNAYQQESHLTENYDPKAFQQQQDAYTQDGYDPNAYQQQEENYTKDSYDPNAYQQQQEIQAEHNYNPSDYQQQQESYAQDSYDPNAYQQQQQRYTQDNYDAPAIIEQSSVSSQPLSERIVSPPPQQQDYSQDIYSPSAAIERSAIASPPTAEHIVSSPPQQEQQSYTQDSYDPNAYSLTQTPNEQFSIEDLQTPQNETNSSSFANTTSPTPQTNFMSFGYDSLAELDLQHQESSKAEGLDELNDLVLGSLSAHDEQTSLAPTAELSNEYGQTQKTSEREVTNNYGHYQNQQQDNVYEPYTAAHTVGSTLGSPEFSSGPPKSNPVASSIPPPPRGNSISSVSSNVLPPRANSIKSVSSPTQSTFIQRTASPSYNDNRNQASFEGYYHPPVAIERSATVPPPMTERIASPRPQLVPCPDPQCEGENKPKAKFCCECGRPLAGISRSTTPAANLSSEHMESFNPASFGAVAEQMQRNALDDAREAIKNTMSQFIESSTVIHEDRQLALDYIQRRLPTFEEESKVLLWTIVKTMLEHSDNALGDGGSLDKAIVQLILVKEERDSITRLDELEDILLTGDREKACEFAWNHDMWGHSFIIATGNSELLKRTVTKFVQKELYSSLVELVPQVAGDNKALRLLYCTLNGADAVSEFMKQAANDDEQSLYGWKRALALVLANRSSNDQLIIHELGNQLKKLGSQKDDAQLCYLLSPEPSGKVLLGDDKYTDLDGLFLCEFYEYASKASLPQDFKLILAWWLEELGFTEESKKYCDSIANALQNSSLEDLKKLGDISPNISDTISLLSKQKFDSLISSIEEKSNPQTGYGGYGYGYENNFSVSTEPPKAVTSPFSQPRGIQSPFQAPSNTVKPISSPFAVANTPPNAVSSPFGQPYTANESSGGSWWDSNAATNEQEVPSYEPANSYEPPAENVSAPAYSHDADDDDLGFGNSKTRKGAGLSENTAQSETTNNPTEEKTKEVESKPETEQKEKSSGGWGIFSLFGRHKDANGDEKKPVKANLGEQSSFYYDEKEKRWVNKLNDTKPAAATPPPPPKSLTPQPSAVATPPPPSAMKPNSMPPPRINSAPTVGGPPSGIPPTSFNTPPVSSRRGPGGKKPMRSRYVDVFNQS